MLRLMWQVLQTTPDWTRVTFVTLLHKSFLRAKVFLFAQHIKSDKYPNLRNLLKVCAHQQFSPDENLTGFQQHPDR